MMKIGIARMTRGAARPLRARANQNAYRSTGRVIYFQHLPGQAGIAGAMVGETGYRHTVISWPSATATARPVMAYRR